MKSIFTLFTIALFATSCSHVEIIASEYMSTNFIPNSESFLVRIEPNKELAIPAVRAMYKKSSNMKTIINSVSLQNGVDLIIPKEINGFKITELSFIVDQAYFDGASQVMFGGVSMWASQLEVEFFSENGLFMFNQTVNYQLEHIGFHGRHPFFCPENQAVKVTLNGLTTLKFTPYENCVN